MSKKIILTAAIVLSALLCGCKPQSPQLGQATENSRADDPFSKRQMNVLTALVQEDLNSYVNGGDTMAEDAGWMKGVARGSAQKIQGEYEANEVAADKNYRGKQILLTATVKSIDRGIGENYFLQLIGGSNMFISPKARMSDGYIDYLANLKKGQKVALMCKGAGMLMGSATFEKCLPATDWVAQLTKDVVASINSGIKSKEIHSSNLAAAAVAIDSLLPTTSSCETNAADQCISEISSVFKQRGKPNKTQIVDAAKKLGIDSAVIK